MEKKKLLANARKKRHIYSTPLFLLNKRDGIRQTIVKKHGENIGQKYESDTKIKPKMPFYFE